MIFAILTLLAALALAAVAGWFSIIGLMAILAGQPVAALVLGATLELGKLVTTSWLYRNWDKASWKLKTPLIYFTFALMLATSMGVFGFLSKAHLEQGAPTMDNSSKIERITQQIDREKALIADNDKVIQQLDATVNSFLGKDRADRALSVRKSQIAQRKQLKDDSDATQKRIEALNDEKFKLESDLRKLQLEVGPIRYIAELIYGTEKSDNKTLESAVRIFTLIIVSTLDPLAITLLIAANFTLLKLKDEKGESVKKTDTKGKISSWFNLRKKAGEVLIPYHNEDDFKTNVPLVEPLLPKTLGHIDLNAAPETTSVQETSIREKGSETISPVLDSSREIRILEEHNSGQEIAIETPEEISEIDYKEETAALADYQRKSPIIPRIHQPSPTRVHLSEPKAELQEETTFSGMEDKEVSEISVEVPRRRSMVEPWAAQTPILRELLGNAPHFVPQKLNEKEEEKEIFEPETEVLLETEETSSSKKNSTAGNIKSTQEVDESVKENQVDEVALYTFNNTTGSLAETHKYPKTLSWVNIFRRS